MREEASCRKVLCHGLYRNGRRTGNLTLNDRSPTASTARSFKSTDVRLAGRLLGSYSVAISIAWIFSLSAMVAGCVSSAAASGKALSVYAVIVGVVEFQDPEIPPLQLSVKDATDFYNFLKERESMFASMHLNLLVNEKATRANITEALRNRLRSAEKDDVVIIYLSGHGAVDALMTNEFYFVTYDTRRTNLFGTALLMNDKNLFKGIASERCLLLADACHSGGFTPGLEKGVKSAQLHLSLFEGVRGRIGIASSRPEEQSYERPVFGNSVFTHFILKGLRGEAVTERKSGIVSVRSLFEYVAKSTRQATDGGQNPQLFNAEMVDVDAPIFQVPAYSSSLQARVQFQYEDEARRVQPLTNGLTLKSGQRFGVAFSPESDCFVHILWKDSGGRMGVLFPNPDLSTGTSHVRAGQSYWLPSQNGDRWYVLDNNPGEETIYFVASRERNPKLEQLCTALGPDWSASPRGKSEVAAKELEREINLMGFAHFTATRRMPVAGTARTRRDLFEALDTRIRVSGADSIHMVTFKHVSR